MLFLNNCGWNNVNIAVVKCIASARESRKIVQDEKWLHITMQ